MKRKTYFICLLALLSLFCNEQDPIGYPMSEEDKLLKASIIGGWGHRYFHEIYFNADNTFTIIDYYILIDCHHDYPGTIPYHKIHGHYYIEDGILIQYAIERSDESLSKELMDYEPYSMEIQIIDNLLITRSVDILEKKEENKTSLYGTWFLEKWSSSWEKIYKIRPEYEGFVQDYYTFIKDSSEVIYTRTYFNNRSILPEIITGTYRYYLDTLEIQYPPGKPRQTTVKGRTIKFKNNKLFWYTSTENVTWPRLK